MKRPLNIKLIAFYLAIIIIGAYFIPQEKNWTPSFSSKHNWPFGGEIMYDVLQDLFPKAKIQSSTRTLYEMRDSLVDFSGNLLFIQEWLEMDSLDLSVIYDQLDKGNNVFIAAYDFPSSLMDTLKLEMGYQYLIQEIIRTGFGGQELDHHFFTKELQRDSAYQFVLQDANYYFLETDSIQQFRGLAYAGDSTNVNMVKYKLGNGHLYLHSNPYMFTNYYLLEEEGGEYVSKVMSYLPDGDIYWDEHFKAINHQSRDSMLNVVTAKPPLKWALNITVFSILMLLLFMSKRKQRIIPELDMYPNESKELVETVGKLYFNTSTNKNIADKKIKMWKQFLRQEVEYSNGIKQDELIERLHVKKGVSTEKLKKLFKLVNDIQYQHSVSDRQLSILNEEINNITSAKRQE